MGTEFPWRWGRGTISANLDVIWGMSVYRLVKRLAGERVPYLVQGAGYDPVRVDPLCHLFSRAKQSLPIEPAVKMESLIANEIARKTNLLKKLACSIVGVVVQYEIVNALLDEMRQAIGEI